MTIAACYLCSEGVVLGADSTSTMFVFGPGDSGGSYHHFDFAQKLFELGDDSTAGIVTWGLGSLGSVSYRTLIAEVADASDRAADLERIAACWSDRFWKQYTHSFGSYLERARLLRAKSVRTEEEGRELTFLWDTFSGGFCIGGRWGKQRSPCAYEILFDPLRTEPPEPTQLQTGHARFWGCPNLIERVLYGIDENLFGAVAESKWWTGTKEDLLELVAPNMLSQPQDLPLREAIDWVFASVYTTIKAMKFSHLAPVCGGGIEVAVITSDRPFRWVRHKSLGEAIAASVPGRDWL